VINYDHSHVWGQKLGELWSTNRKGYNFWGICTPKVWEGKNRSKFGVISENFGIWLRISADRIEISTIWRASEASDQLQPLNG